MLKLLVATLTMITSTAIAEEHSPWSTVGLWNIFVADPVEDGCYMERQFDDGTVVQVGTVASLDGGFFAAYNPAWTDIEIGATGLLKFNFGDALFGGDVEGRLNNDLPGGYAFFDNPGFVNEFAKRLAVTITGPKDKSFEVDLKGSKKAIDAALACQKENTK